MTNEEIQKENVSSNSIEKIDITYEKYKKKADELGILHKCKVHPLVLLAANNSEEVIGYLKEPQRQVKSRLLDKIAAMEPISACSEVLEAYLIKEESDARILEDDKYFYAASLELYSTIQVAASVFKKK